MISNDRIQHLVNYVTHLREHEQVNKTIIFAYGANVIYTPIWAYRFKYSR